MAIAYTAVTGAHRVEGNKRVRVFDLVFSGNYATGGEAWSLSSIGLRKVDFVRLSGGAAPAGDEATAVVIGVDYTASKFVFYEGSAAGTALSEKTNAEAYPAGCYIRAEFVGY